MKIQDVYYHREYGNDVAKPAAGETCKRVAFAALPFLSLYKPFSFPLSLALGGLRTVTSAMQLYEQPSAQHAVKTALSAAAVAGTIFAHPMGMVITTGHDLVIETGHLIEALQQGDPKKAMESCMIIVNNALYLALLTQGGIELAIASFAVQILIGGRVR